MIFNDEIKAKLLDTRGGCDVDHEGHARAVLLNVKSGEVTHRELKRIRKDQRKIARMDRRFGGDGRYTKRERRKLNSALDRASRRVYRVKNNRRVVDNGRTRKHRR